jgi:DNA-binding PadR family transcriptional regulator
MEQQPRRSPLALAVLALLAEAPMHPYRMQQLIRQRGKDEVINVAQRAGLYKTIDRLRQAGLIAVRETTRDQQRPERSVYELTDQGRAAAYRWLRDALATPGHEFPEFPAAVSFLALLAPSDALRQLETRRARLEHEQARLRANMAEGAALVPRLFLLETEYQLAVLDAELGWLAGVIDDLRAGRLAWDLPELLRLAATLNPPEEAD